MKLDKLVAVSGRPGIYKLKANRQNGLILEDMDTGKRFFASGRMHQFTPLESISIYTTDFSEDGEVTVELKDVFRSMLEKMEEHPPLSSKANSVQLREYFEIILPKHDQTKVLNSDIKKIIKWFNFLNERDMLSLEEETPEEEEITEEENTETPTED